MSITSSAVKYNKIASEYALSGEMTNTTVTSLPDTPISKQWRTEPCFLPKSYELIGYQILDFEVRPDDIWIISYPKTGTTWVQEMAWMLCNDLDYRTASKVITERYHFLEFDTVSVAQQAPSPRFIKSHLPVQLLPRQLWQVKPKIVYVGRNPKDTAVSYYYHLKNMQGCEASFEESLDAFMNDQVLFSPFHSHVLNFWNMRNEKFVHFVMYEDMKANLNETLQRMAHFFGKSYSSEEFLALEKHLSFDAMRANKFVNFDAHVEFMRRRPDAAEIPSQDFKFMRKGKSGGFASEMSPDTIARFDDWTWAKCNESDFKFAL